MAAANDKQRVTKRPISAPDMLNEAFDYDKRVSFVRAMRVESGDISTIYLSGTASVNEKGESIHPGDLKAQARRMFENIRSLLAIEGADWHDIVRTTCYLADMRDYDAFNEVRNAFYDEVGLDPFPAATCIEARICRVELLVEMEAIAVIPANRKP